MNIPLLKPAPARLSGLGAELQAIEESGWFSNFGPMSLRLEREMTERLFG